METSTGDGPLSEGRTHEIMADTTAITDSFTAPSHCEKLYCGPLDSALLLAELVRKKV
jgi:hypothetical protein